MRTKTTQEASVLPAGIEKGDLKMPAYEETAAVKWDDRQFELWFTTSLGWCIPTLLIGKARGHQASDRTYAVTMAGNVCRIGRGPHVTRLVTVYVRTSRQSALQRFLDLRQSGAGLAGEVRDRISSRRAQGQVERAEGRSSWRWDV